VARAARTRDVVLAHAARLFAERGYGGTTVADLGAACGISGPALYKHFRSKYAVLARLLLDISEQLDAGGRAVVASTPDPHAALVSLVEFHVAFALAERDVIRVQDRDLDTLTQRDSQAVRRLQRHYAETWVMVMRRAQPDVPERVARLRVHAAFGLMNSTPHMPRRSELRRELVAMALRALDVRVSATG